jgi:hypothetical protein
MKNKDERILHMIVSNKTLTLLKIEAARQNKKMPAIVEELVEKNIKK